MDKVAEKILMYSDIDTRVKFSAPSRKISYSPNFIFRSELVYDNESMALYDFTEMCYDSPRWFKYDRIPFSGVRSTEDRTVVMFNLEWQDHLVTMFGDDYVIGPTIIHRHFITPRRVKFK